MGHEAGMIPELTVIVPVFNEQQEVCGAVGAIARSLDKIDVAYEIVVVDDGSCDKTLEIVQAMDMPCLKVLAYQPNKGKGCAIHHGMLHARGQYCLFMDVDLSTDLNAIDEFLKLMRSGRYDILIGDRKSDRRYQVRRQPKVRRMLGRVFTFLSFLVIGKYIKDFTCGFKMFNAKAVGIILPRQKIFDWSFDTELMCIAVTHQLRIGQIPVLWKHDGGSKVRLFKDVFVSLWGLMKIKANSIFNKYR